MAKVFTKRNDIDELDVERLQAVMVANRWTLAAVARELGVSRQLLAYHVQARSAYIAPAIAQVLGCRPDELIRRGTRDTGLPW